MALSAEAQAFHDQFVTKLAVGLCQYLSAEAANAQQTLLDAVNAPANALLGHPGMGATPAQYSARVFDYPTPVGPISLTLYGEPSLPGPVTVTGGTLQVPTALALALDAVGPEANVLITLQNSGAAVTNAVHTGYPVAAAEALLETPANAASSFFFGQQTITESYPVPSGTQYTSADVSVPIGGLLTPLEPVTLTMHSSNGTVTSIPLDGTKFGGLISAVEGLLAGS